MTFTDEELGNAVELIRGGFSLREVALTMNVNEDTLRKALTITTTTPAKETKEEQSEANSN